MTLKDAFNRNKQKCKKCEKYANCYNCRVGLRCNEHWACDGTKFKCTNILSCAFDLIYEEDNK